MNSGVSMALIDLRNAIETNYLVLSMTHGNIRGGGRGELPSLVFSSESLRRCRGRRVDVIIGRLGGMAQGNGVLEVNGSPPCLRSPLRPGPSPPHPSDGITFFVILVTCISLSRDPSSRDRTRPLFHYHAVTPEKKTSISPLAINT